MLMIDAGPHFSDELVQAMLEVVVQELRQAGVADAQILRVPDTHYWTSTPWQATGDR